jgi:hypothetical protein
VRSLIPPSCARLMHEQAVFSIFIQGLHYMIENVSR